MLVKLTNEDLNHPRFVEREIVFNLMHRMIEDNDARCLRSSDYGMFYTQSPKLNGWLWIDEKKSKANVELYCAQLIDYFQHDHPPGINGASEVVTELAKIYAQKRNVSIRNGMTMTAYIYQNLTATEVNQQYVRLAEMSDVEVIAQYFARFAFDAYGANVSAESQMKAAAHMIDGRGLYVLEIDHYIVSIANIAHRSKRYGRINAVFTPTSTRKRGYAKQLVTALCGMLVEEGRKPMLYADVANPVSNSLYQSIGFVPAGNIVEIKLHAK